MSSTVNQPMTSAKVEVVAWFPSAVHGLALDPLGNLYLSDTFGTLSPNRRVWAVTPPYQGAVLDIGAASPQPAGLTWSNQGLLVTDPAAGRVTQYTTQGGAFFQSQIWTVPASWNAVVLPDGDLLAVTVDGRVVRSDGATVRTVISALDAPFDVALDGTGGVWVSEQGVAAGAVSRFDLASGQRLETINYPWRNPEGLAVDDTGALWITETERGEVLRYADGVLAVAATGLSFPIGLTAAGGTSVLVGSAGALVRITF